MTTPSDDLPNKSSGEKQETEAEKQKWSEFLESLTDRVEKKFSPILTDISKDSFEAAAKTFKEVASSHYKSALAFGEKLSEAFKLKLIREEQIITFFENSLKLETSYYEGLILNAICNDREIKSDLSKKLLSLYLKSLVKIDPDEAESAFDILMKKERSKMMITEVYQFLNEEIQEKLLTIIFSRSIQSIDSNFHYAVKVANPQLFEKFIHSSLKNLHEEARDRINKQINENYCL